MLPVMDFHRLCVDVRLERVRSVGKRRKRVRHDWSPVWFRPTESRDSWSLRAGALALPRDETGQQGEKDHEQDDFGDVMLDARDVPAEEVTHEQHRPDPEYRAQHVIGRVDAK